MADGDSNEDTDARLASSDRRSAADRTGERLYEAVYAELRSIATALLLRERAGHTLQPTALVHEAYFKLAGNGEAAARDRVHFLAIASRAMRQVLVDYARSRGAIKRAGVRTSLQLQPNLPDPTDRGTDILDLDRALVRLAELSERVVQVVELRVFGGLTHEEIAEALGVSARTVAGDWKVARHWLRRELSGEPS